MPEPTLPFAATVAGFTMTVVSWYGLLRNGIQQVYNDIKSIDTWEEDVNLMLVDLGNLQRGMRE
jgi:hypothetical protein